MRIAYLSSSRLPSQFANSVHVVKMCRALAGSGHTVTLHAKAGQGDPLAPYGIGKCFDVSLADVPAMRFIGPLRFALHARRRIRAMDIDLLYARHVWSLAACASLGIPFVYEAHTLPRTGIHRRLEQWLFAHQGFRRLVVISDALRVDYLEAFPQLHESQVLVAHDGADIAQLPRPANNWPGRAGALQVGYVGHLYPGKGMEMVAEVAPLMPDVDFHVVGGTPADLARWKANASYPNLHFHGFVPHAELSAKYAALDVVLVPLQRRVALQGGKGDIGKWTSPLKLFEAMAHGRALVVSDHPTLLEVVKDGHDALVARADNVQDWVRCLGQLKSDRDLRSRLGANALETLRNEYTWNERAGRVLRGIAA